MNYVLNLLILLPFIGMLFTLFIKYPDIRTVRNVRNVRLIVTTSQIFLCCIALFLNLTLSKDNLSSAPYVTGLSFGLKADGFSLLFMLVASVFFFLVTLIDWNIKIRLPKDYSVLFLWLESMTFGIFCASDIISFIFFFIGAIIPLCMLLRIYSFTDKDKYFFAPLFTLIFICGGVLMFSLLLLGKYSESYLLSSLNGFLLAPKHLFITKNLILLSLMGTGYIFPVLASDRCNISSSPTGLFYTASTAPFICSIYTIIRLSNTMPNVSTAPLSNAFCIVALCGLLYLSLKTIIQKDLRKVIGCYTNIYITICFIGVLSSSLLAKQGTFLLVLNYIPALAALILITIIIHNRIHSSHIFEISGLYQNMPIFAVFFFLVCLCSSFFPFTGGFSGIFLIMKDTFQTYPLTCVSITLSAMTLTAYIFYSYQNIALGIAPERVKELPDISVKESILILICLCLTVWLGLSPDWLLTVAGNNF